MNNNNNHLTENSIEIQPIQSETLSNEIYDANTKSQVELEVNDEINSTPKEVL